MYQRLKSSKKPNSSVAGDIPPKIMKAFVVEYAKPATHLFNKITETGDYPRKWVIETQFPIKKEPNPEDADSLRLISKTSFLSKIYESFLRDWLMPIVTPFLDPANYGGLKKTSTIHYLLNLLKFIHEELNEDKPQAVMMVQGDMKKAFNKISHYDIIVDLQAMKVTGWLLRILC